MLKSFFAIPIAPDSKKRRLELFGNLEIWKEKKELFESIYAKIQLSASISSMTGIASLVVSDRAVEVDYLIGFCRLQHLGAANHELPGPTRLPDP